MRAAMVTYRDASGKPSQLFRRLARLRRFGCLHGTCAQLAPAAQRGSCTVADVALRGEAPLCSARRKPVACHSVAGARRARRPHPATAASSKSTAADRDGKKKGRGESARPLPGMLAPARPSAAKRGSSCDKAHDGCFLFEPLAPPTGDMSRVTRVHIITDAQRTHGSVLARSAAARLPSQPQRLQKGRARVRYNAGGAQQAFGGRNALRAQVGRAPGAPSQVRAASSCQNCRARARASRWRATPRAAAARRRSRLRASSCRGRGGSAQGRATSRTPPTTARGSAALQRCCASARRPERAPEVCWAKNAAA